MEQKVGTVTGNLTGLRIGVLGGRAQGGPSEAELIDKIEEWYRRSPVNGNTAPQPANVPAPAQPATPVSQQPAVGPTTLLNPSEAAEHLRVTEPDVMAAIQAGELKAKKIGSSYRIRREDLDAFLNG